MEPAIKSNGVPLVNASGVPALCKEGGCCVDEECDLVADFDFDKIGDPCHYSFIATASSTYPVVSYSWDFGDGGTGSGITVTHPYFTGITTVFNVTLTVTDSNGCVVVVTKTLACSATCGCIEAVTEATIEVGSVDGGFCEAACNLIEATYIVALQGYTYGVCTGTVSNSLALCDNVCATSTADRTVRVSVTVTITRNDVAGTVTLSVALSITPPTSDEDACRSGYANYETVIGEPGLQCKGTYELPLEQYISSICGDVPETIEVVLT